MGCDGAVSAGASTRAQGRQPSVRRAAGVSSMRRRAVTRALCGHPCGCQSRRACPEAHRQPQLLLERLLRKVPIQVHENLQGAEQRYLTMLCYVNKIS